jgi:DNA-binding MarR family transcriptional regulator
MKPQDTVDFHIRWSWHNISRMYNMKASEFEGTMAIGYTLLNIDKDGTPSTKLGPKMGMEPRSLTRMIKSLEKKGLINRKPDDNDKRMVNLFLTEKGKEWRKKARAYVIHFNEKVNDKIDANEIKTCFKVLQEINEIIDDNNIFNKK